METTQHRPYNAHTIDLPKETTFLLRPLSLQCSHHWPPYTFLLRPLSTVPTMLTLLTSLKRPLFYWDHCPYNAHTIDLPKETTSLLRPLSTLPTKLTLFTSLKRPPLYWDHCPYNAHTIDLPKETTSLLRPLSTVPTMLTLLTRPPNSSLLIMYAPPFNSQCKGRLSWSSE